MGTSPPDRSVTGHAIEPASPAPSLRCAKLNPASTQTPRPGFVPPITAAPPAPPPLRHCAGQRQSCSPACGLQAATVPDAPPRQRLRHWLSRSCYRRSVSADFFGFGWRCRVLPAVCAASFAHGSVGYLNPGLLAVLDYTQAGRGKSHAIEHNSALPEATAPPAEKLLSAWAATRPAGLGNGLLCPCALGRPKSVLRRCAGFQSVQCCGSRASEKLFRR